MHSNELLNHVSGFDRGLISGKLNALHLCKHGFVCENLPRRTQRISKPGMNNG